MIPRGQICPVVTFSGYFYLMAIIGTLPTSNEPPVLEPNDTLRLRSPIIVLLLASSIGR